MSEILKVEHVSKSFAGVRPVRDVSFSVCGLSVVLITGENGAGKTTLFNLITGLEKPTNGKIIFNGTDITTKSALEISRLGITRLYQHPRLFKNLLVWENLVSAAHHNVASKFASLFVKYRAARQEDESLRQKASELLAKFGLQMLSERVAGELSYGQQKLISFCMIGMNGAQLALLDEPFAGLQPRIIERFSDMILQMRSEGSTFLIIEHNINKALAIADCHIEMSNGQIKLQGANTSYG